MLFSFVFHHQLFHSLSVARKVYGDEGPRAGDSELSGCKSVEG